MEKIIFPILIFLLVNVIVSCHSNTHSAPVTKQVDTISQASSVDTTLLPIEPQYDFKMDKGKLEKRVIDLDVTYQAIACTCAHWAETKDSVNQRKEYFYLEPANSSLKGADDFFDGLTLPNLQLKGSFYSKQGYPENYNPTKGNPAHARVFRYTSIKLINRKTSSK